MTSPVVNPAWQAARAGLPADLSATAHAAQAGQFLAAHGVSTVYRGGRAWTPAVTTHPGYFSWIGSGQGWVAAEDVDQSFTLPSGTTAVSRVRIAVLPSGGGADLQANLYPDDGGGTPLLTSPPLASCTIPASHLLALAAPDGAGNNGPLGTAQHNTLMPGTATTTTWTPTASSTGGPPTDTAAVSDGNWTVLAGGLDAIPTNPLLSSTFALSYLGAAGGAPAITQFAPRPSTPEGAFFRMIAMTPDTIVVAGGFGVVSGTVQPVASVWTAPWDPLAGTIGGWTQQAALPAVTAAAVTVASGQNLYVIGGGSSGLGNPAATVWRTVVSSGQITTWLACPPLPAARNNVIAGVVNGWLVAAGGTDGSGNPAADCWYARVGADGSLSPWQAAPAMPVPAGPIYPYTNQAVAGNAIIALSSPQSTSAYGPWTMILPVTADGPATAWTYTGTQVQGSYLTGWYPGPETGQLVVVMLGNTAYHVQTFVPVPMISVPLPATGLTPGATYHVLFRQLGGDQTSNYLSLGQVTHGVLPWQSTAQFSISMFVGDWTPSPAGQALMMEVYDNAANGAVWHLSQDQAARHVSVTQGGGTHQLLGTTEATAIAPGPVNANPDFTSTAGWSGLNGTFTVTTAPGSPPFPADSAGRYVNNGTDFGGMQEAGQPFPAIPGDWYWITAWVYSSERGAQLEIAWLDSAGGALTTDTWLFGPFANTWTQFAVPFQAPPAAAQGYPIVGNGAIDGGTIYAQHITITAASPGQVTAVTQVAYNDQGLPSGLVTLA